MTSKHERERERERERGEISTQSVLGLFSFCKYTFFPAQRTVLPAFLFSISAGRRKKFDLNKNRNNPSVVHEKFK